MEMEISMYNLFRQLMGACFYKCDYNIVVVKIIVLISCTESDFLVGASHPFGHS